MRSADRLFQIVLTIGRERTITGKRLAEMLGVTTRTVYRDIRSLIVSGVPIQGEAGVGYRLRRGYQVPPLMFTDEELQALHLGASIVRTWADAGLASAAEQVLAKVDAVLPATSRPKLTYGAMIVPGGHVPTVISDHMSVLRRAINSRRKVLLNYPRPFSECSDRIVRPLILAYWGGSWTLGAWCEKVIDFRTFRVDGISGLAVSGAFDDEPNRGLAAYLTASPAHDAVLGCAVDALKSGSPLWPTSATGHNAQARDRTTSA